MDKEFKTIFDNLLTEEVFKDKAGDIDSMWEIEEEVESFISDLEDLRHKLMVLTLRYNNIDEERHNRNFSMKSLHDKAATLLEQIVGTFKPQYETVLNRYLIAKILEEEENKKLITAFPTNSIAYHHSFVGNIQMGGKLNNKSKKRKKNKIGKNHKGK